MNKNEELIASFHSNTCQLFCFGNLNISLTHQSPAKYRLSFLSVTQPYRIMEIVITRQVSSMTHSARPIVTPVANIVFCCFVLLDLKSGDERTDNMCENKDSYRPCLWVGRVDQFYIFLNQLFSPFMKSYPMISA